MKPEDAKKAYPPTPDWFTGYVRHALNQTEEIAMKRISAKKPATSMALALLIVLLLTGIAFAASHFGLLDYLLPGGVHEPTKELVDSIQQLNASGSDDGVKIAVTSGIYDGERISVTWMTENTNPKMPVVVELESIMLDGDSLNPSSFPGTWLIPAPFETGDVESGPKRGMGLVADVPEAVDGKATVQMRFMIQRPVNELIVVDGSLYADWNEEFAARMAAQRKRIEDSGTLIAGKEESSPDDWEEWAARGYTVIDSFGDVPTLPGARSTYGIYWERPGQFEKSGEITLTFELNMADAKRLILSAAPIDPVSFNGYTVEFERIAFTPISTLMDMVCYPEEGVYADMDAVMAHYDAQEAEPWFAFFDENGKLVDTVSMDWCAGWNSEETKDGGYVLHMQEKFPGLLKMPASLVLFEEYASTYDVRKLDDIPADSQTLLIPLEYIEME